MSTGLRIAGVTIPGKKHIEIGLTSIFGVGRKTARKICAEAGVNPSAKGMELSNEDETALRAEVEKFTTEGDLRRKIAADKMRLKAIQCYRALRHLKGLPCRGQNTRNNSETAGRVK